MSYVYLSRNDGKILRGSPLLWESRLTFANQGQLELLGIEEDENNFLTQNGFLELKSKNVRL